MFSWPALRDPGLRALRSRPELALVAVLSIGLVAYTWPVPLGLWALGAVSGAAYAMQAAGLIVVYRANRVINFAQFYMLALAGQTFVDLVQQRFFLVQIQKICPSCFAVPAGLPSPARLRSILPQIVREFPGLVNQYGGSEGSLLQHVDQVRNQIILLNASTTWQLVNFVVAALLSIGVAVLVIWLFYYVIIDRFTQAPRLVLTVMTLAFGLFMSLVAQRLDGSLFGGKKLLYTKSAAPPFNLNLTLHPAILGSADFATFLLAAVALGALAWFFRRSTVGTVMRGAADNPQRAATLGVPVSSVTARAWLISGGLASVAAVLLGMTNSEVGAQTGDTMVAILAAAAIAGFASLPLAVFGGLLIGMLNEGLLFHLSTTDPASLLIFVLVVGVFLLQRQRASRADLEVLGSWLASREIRPTPPELRPVPSVRNTYLIGSIVLGAVVLGLPWITSPAQTDQWTNVMLIGMVGISLLILTGWAGQMSLGQMAFAGIGGYVTVWLHVPFPLDVLIAGLAGSLSTVFVGLPALRLRGLHLAVTTLAFNIVVSDLVLNPSYLASRLPFRINRPHLLGLDLSDQRVFYYTVLVITLGVLGSVVGLRRSRTARVLIACKDNESAAQSFGISLTRVRLAAFALSGFFAAVAGGLLAISQNGLQAASFTADQSILVFLYTIFGGFGAVVGPILGSLWQGIWQLPTSGVLGLFAPFLGSPGLGVVFIMWFAPGGLLQVLAGIRDAFLRRVAERYRIDVPSLLGEHVRGELLPIVPKTWPSGGVMAIPQRYRLSRQWVVQTAKGTVSHG